MLDNFPPDYDFDTPRREPRLLYTGRLPRQRPLGITLFALFSVFEGLASALFLCRLYGMQLPRGSSLVSSSDNGPTLIINPTDLSATYNAIRELMLVVWIVAIASVGINLALAMGLWELQAWARPIALGWYMSAFSSAILNAFLKVPTIVDVLNAVLSGVILRYMLEPRIRLLFRRAS